MSFRLPRAATTVQRDPGYARVADLVPPSARRILHLGCGNGIAALLLKLRDPGRHVTGVVGDAALALEAAQRCDAVLAPAVTGQLPPRSFDCIIASDLLDGAADPAASLRSVLRLLVPGGHFVVEAPSAAWAQAAAAASGGNVDAGYGFTRHRLVQLLQAAGCEMTGLRLDLWNSAPPALLSLTKQAAPLAGLIEESRTPRFFATCVFAEAAARIPVCSVIVRAAGSAAATLAALRQEAERVDLQIVVADGPTAADLNRASRCARGRYLAFVDAGTAPQAGWIAALMQTLQTTPEAAVAGSVLLDGDGALQSCGFELAATELPYRHYPFAIRQPPRGEATVVPAVAIDGMLIERSRFILHAGFDERLAEELFDTELCLRLRAHGHLAVCCSSSTLRTARSEADEDAKDTAVSSDGDAACGRSRLHFADKWSPQIEATMLHDPVVARPPGLELGRRRRKSGTGTYFPDEGPRSPVSARPPLMWSGHIFGAGGYAESTRNFLTALDRAGIRTLVNPFSSDTPTTFEEAIDFDRYVIERAPRNFVSIVSRPGVFFRRQPQERIAIGRTMNETDRIPAGWVARCNQMDQIWVPSHFNLDAFARSGVDRERLFVIPETIDERLYGPDVEPLAVENVSGFVFLSVFLQGPRKGWTTLLRAYLDEFGREEDVTLLLRVSPAIHSPLTQLTGFIRAHLGGEPESGPRIVLCPASVGGPLMPRLYRGADAFVLPSRGEGWGRPYMEAMASGLPTIGTGWSGNTEFMHADNSYLLDYKLVPHNDPSLPPHFHTPEHTLWAEPSVEHLKTLMRSVFENRDAGAKLGAIARESVLDRFRHDQVARMIVERLQESGIEPARVRQPSRAAPTPVCSVVLVAQDPARAKQCIESLDASAPRFAWELVVVVRDGYEDKAGRLRSRVASRTTVVRAAQERSPAAARNLAAGKALGEFLVFVDDGTRPKPGWMDALVGVCRGSSSVAIVGSKILARDASLLHAGLAIGPGLLPYPIHRGSPPSAPAVNRLRAMSAVSGTGMLVSRKFFAGAGGFDESLLGPLADADLCWRLRQRDLDVLYCPDSELEHDEMADPGPRGNDHGRIRFLERWAPAVLPDDTQICQEDGLDLLAARAGDWPMPPRGLSPSRRAPAVLWSAPVFDRSGYANEARDYVLALDEAGVEVYVNAFESNRSAAGLVDQVVKRITELATAELPSHFVHVFQHQALRFVRHPQAIANIGRTMFETDTLPADRVQRCNAMDEIWVPSQFNIETFTRAGIDAHRLVVIPEAIDADLYRRQPQSLEIADASGFVFLSVFAWSVRKGWDLLLRAYVEEFRRDEDVTLVLGISTTPTGAPADPGPVLASHLRDKLGRDPAATARIVAVPLALSPQEMPALYAAADAFVLPSRGEGWGRPYMEAMACGLPTIGTGWSGNTGFMNAGNSFLIDYDLVDLPEDGWARPGLFRGHRWAEPSVEHLMALMRQVYEDRDAAREVGRRARDEVLEQYDRRVVARTMLERIRRAAG